MADKAEVLSLIIKRRIENLDKRPVRKSLLFQFHQPLVVCNYLIFPVYQFQQRFFLVPEIFPAVNVFLLISDGLFEQIRMDLR